MTIYQNFRAGYICDAISRAFEQFVGGNDQKEASGKVAGLLASLTAFDIRFPDVVVVD